MIIPAILENSIDEIQKKINLVEGLVERVQIDVVDGIFADNLTVSPVDLLGVDFFDLGVDIHLMTEEPMDLIAECVNLGGKVKDLRIIGQIERMSNQAEFVRLGIVVGYKIGLALDLFTPVSSIKPELFLQLNCILLMSVRAGFQAQKFDRRVIDKIVEAKKLYPQTAVLVDGGLEPDSISKCRAIGADQFAVGSWLWEHKDIALAIKELNVFAE